MVEIVEPRGRGLRGPRRRRLGRRAAERRLDRDGHRQRALRGDRVRRRADAHDDVLRLPGAVVLRSSRRSRAELIEGGEGAEVHGLGETALPLVPRGARQCAAVARGRPDAHARAPRGDPRRRSTPEAPRESALTLNGEQRVVRDRGRRAAARRPARRRARERARELRDRPVRRLHRAGRRRADLELPAARAARRGPRGRRRSRVSPATIRCSARSTRPRAFQCGYCTPGMVLSAKALAGAQSAAPARPRCATG